MAVSAAEEGKQSKQAEQEGDHRTGIFSGSAPPDQSLGAGRSFGEGQANVMERVALLTDAPVLTADRLELAAPPGRPASPQRRDATPAAALEGMSLEETVERLER